MFITITLEFFAYIGRKYGHLHYLKSLQDFLTLHKNVFILASEKIMYLIEDFFTEERVLPLLTKQKQIAIN